jgi:hypothetical protein
MDFACAKGKKKQSAGFLIAYAGRLNDRWKWLVFQPLLILI